MGKRQSKGVTDLGHKVGGEPTEGTKIGGAKSKGGKGVWLREPPSSEKAEVRARPRNTSINGLPGNAKYAKAALAFLRKTRMGEVEDGAL